MMPVIRERPIGRLPEEFGFPKLKMLRRSVPAGPWWAKADEQVRALCAGSHSTILGGGLIAQMQSARGWINTRHVDVLTEDEYTTLIGQPTHTSAETLFLENVEIIYFTTIQSERTVVGILSYMYGDLSRAKVYASSNASSTKIAHTISQIPSFNF